MFVCRRKRERGIEKYSWERERERDFKSFFFQQSDAVAKLQRAGKNVQKANVKKMLKNKLNLTFYKM